MSKHKKPEDHELDTSDWEPTETNRRPRLFALLIWIITVGCLAFVFGWIFLTMAETSPGADASAPTEVQGPYSVDAVPGLDCHTWRVSVEGQPLGAMCSIVCKRASGGVYRSFAIAAPDATCRGEEAIIEIH